MSTYAVTTDCSRTIVFSLVDDETLDDVCQQLEEILTCKIEKVIAIEKHVRDRFYRLEEL